MATRLDRRRPATTARPPARRRGPGATGRPIGAGRRADGPGRRWPCWRPTGRPTGRAGAVAMASARWLASTRRPDGSLGVTVDLPEPGWPTPLASLLWAALGRVRGRAGRRPSAGSWRLEGRTIARVADDPMGHDGTLVGWPWVAGTHSWVEPTAMALLALGREGLAGHPRAREGVRVLRDRAIPGGGWNLGNPVVFGTPLRPAARPDRPGPAGPGGGRTAPSPVVGPGDRLPPRGPGRDARPGLAGLGRRSASGPGGPAPAWLGGSAGLGRSSGLGPRGLGPVELALLLLAAGRRGRWTSWGSPDRCRGGRPMPESIPPTPPAADAPGVPGRRRAWRAARRPRPGRLRTGGRGRLAGRRRRRPGRVVRRRPGRGSSATAWPSWAWARPGPGASRSCSSRTWSSPRGRPRTSTPTRRWSGPSPRSSGRGTPARSSWPRGRGTAATPASSWSSRASARSWTRRAWSSSTSTTTTSSSVPNRRGFTRLRTLHLPGHAPAGRPGRLAAQDEDAPLGGRHAGDEEPLRRDARRGLRLAQERPAPRGDPRLDPRHQRGGRGPAWRSSTGSSAWRGTGRSWGRPGASGRAGDGHEPAGRRRHRRPPDGDRPRRGSPTSPAPRAGSGRSPRATSASGASRSTGLARPFAILDHPSLAYLRG